jgi:two-component system, OmpR family, aerobic respiration control sensor histidine kinase ArcB
MKKTSNHASTKNSNDKIARNEPIIISLTKDLLIYDINSFGAKEFFKETKSILINKSLIDLLIERNIETKYLLNAFSGHDNSFFQLVTLEHTVINKIYSVIIIHIDGSNKTEYTLTMIPLNKEYSTLEAYNKAIINNLPGAVYWKDQNGYYMGCNKYVATMAGYDDPDEMIGKTDYDLCWGEFAEDWRKLDLKVMKDKRTIIREEKAKLANGQIITELTFKTPLKNENDEVMGIIGTSLDITDRKKMEAALHKSQLAAEAANSAKTEFLANMSHDIRTPLSGVIGLSEVLETELVDVHQKEEAHLLYESGTQLLNMLNEILDDVRVGNANKMDVQEEAFDLYQCINNLIKLEAPTTTANHLGLQCKIDESVPQYIISDRKKIHHILLNLLGNAVKFTKTGHITIQVKCLDCTKVHVHLQFGVADTGIGIPKKMQNKVFDRFFRADPSFKGIYTGYGLGLHIVQSYINLLGGHITLTSKEGVGTTFYFDIKCRLGKQKDLPPTANGLPIKKPMKPPKKTTKTPQPSTNTNIAHILLVEDNAIALKVLESFVSRAGYNFTSARNGESALKIIKTKKFDLLITDIGLPGISGLKLTKNIREWEKETKNPPIPIVGLTGHAKETAKPECISFGMNDVFIKPINLITVKEIVKQFVIKKIPKQE